MKLRFEFLKESRPDFKPNFQRFLRVSRVCHAARVAESHAILQAAAVCSARRALSFEPAPAMCSACARPACLRPGETTLFYVSREGASQCRSSKTP
eukprot:6193782-Pleurochrysis_carterae.AAC.3